MMQGVLWLLMTVLWAGPYDPTEEPQPVLRPSMLSCSDQGAAWLGHAWYAVGERLGTTQWTLAAVDCARGVVRVTDGNSEEEWWLWDQK